MMAHQTSQKKTLITEDVSIAAECIKNGGLVAFPTETVFGLGANALDGNAVKQIFLAKGRPADNPLIVHVADYDSVRELTSHVPDYAETLMKAFFPGPLTLVFPRASHIPDVTTAGLETVAVRMPDHVVAQALIAQSGTGIAAPSANRSGRPSPTTWQDVFEDLNGRVDVILKGDHTRVGLESTVVDCTGEYPIILRPGSISLEDLLLINSKTEYSSSSLLSGRSPGTNHRHYQPNAKVILVDENSEMPELEKAAFLGMTGGEGAKTRFVAVDIIEYAHHVFSFFRHCEKEGIGIIYCQKVSRTGLGSALMDRLDRASA
jgi:L-threonylcarbamoyladenylate synthase